MIEHIVMLDLAEGHDVSELDVVMAGLGALTARIDGFDRFRAGPNRDFEGKSATYPYGFVCSFRDPEALSLYATDADHRALGARLVALCRGGASGVMVIDLDLADA